MQLSNIKILATAEFYLNIQFEINKPRTQYNYYFLGRNIAFKSRNSDSSYIVLGGSDFFSLVKTILKYEK